MNRWLLRPRVMAGIAARGLRVHRAVPAAGESGGQRATSWRFTGAAPFDERPAGYTLSGVLTAFRQLGAQGLFDYEAYRASTSCSRGCCAGWSRP